MNNDSVVARYQQANDLMLCYFGGPITNDAICPHWIDKGVVSDGKAFSYRRELKGGFWEYYLVDVDTRRQWKAFDHNILANALSKTTEQTINPIRLNFDDLIFTSLSTIQFGLFDQQWSFDNETQMLNRLGRSEDVSEAELVSPDGNNTAFVRDHNLWLREIATGKERALTQDGETDNRYASGFTHELMPTLEASWSPDSQYLFTFQLDKRDIPMLNTLAYRGNNMPGWEINKPFNVATTESEQRESYRLLVINTHTGDVQAVDNENIANINFGLMKCFFTGDFTWWSPDSHHAYFVDIKAGMKTVCVTELDPSTGDTRVLLEEHSDTFVKCNHGMVSPYLFTPLPESSELIWYSERSGWGHLYLYDLITGELKQQITGQLGGEDKGNWLVRDILHFDLDKRELLLATAGRDKKISPYYRDICRVNIDTGKLIDCAIGNFDHVVANVGDYNLWGLSLANQQDYPGINGVSPCGEYIVFTRSRVDTVPETLLIDRTGREVMPIEVADVSALPDSWVWPEPVSLKADDGETDIYGVVFYPPGFSKDKQYPVWDFNNSYRNFSTMPQTAFATGSFLGLIYAHAAAKAALGFIVVIIEGRATPLRNKAFQDHEHGDFSAANELADHIAGIKQLAATRPYMDLGRVGISGLEGISNLIFGVFKFPEFYKVAVVNMYEDIWDGGMHLSLDGWYGTADPLVTENKVRPIDYVDQFEGKLLLIHGLFNPAITSTFRLISALEAANKEFDQLILPGLGYRVSTYSTLREWNYMVEHLRNEQPPKGFIMTNADDILNTETLNYMASKQAFLLAQGEPENAADKSLLKAIKAQKEGVLDKEVSG